MQYNTDKQEVDTNKEEVVTVERCTTDAFKSIPAGQERELEGQDFWLLLSTFTKWRTEVVKDLAAEGMHKLDDLWLHCSYSTERPSLAEMAAAEEQAVRQRTGLQDNINNPCLWMMLFSPIQQVIQCDPILYTLTITFHNNRDFELYGLPEPAWSPLIYEGGEET